MKAGWYWSSDSFEFLGIKYFTDKDASEHTEQDEIYDQGPFDSWGKAKKDALKSYMADIETLRYTLRGVRATRKPKEK